MVKKILQQSIRSFSRQRQMEILNRFDPQQVALLYEPLIVVDKDDRIIGETTKKDAHLLSNIEKQPSMIHRAFSFFLFDHSTKPLRLIVQQRSQDKITYPLLWANTCCSHPLYNDDEKKGLDGVKHAVQRRVQYELGHDVKVDLFYRSRIFYQARNIPDDGIFGESEVDYIIFGHHRERQPLDLHIDFQINRNEVKSIDSLTLKQCEELVEKNQATPWFSLIVRNGLLAQWWSEFERNQNLESNYENDQIINL